MYAISAALLAYLIIILTFAATKWEEVTCEGVKVRVDNTRDAFVNESEVLKIIQKGYGEILGKKIATVNRDSLERVLEKDPMIRSAQAYHSLDGLVHVVIRQREPMVRVMAGESYYVDRERRVMPLSSRFTSRVLVATGAINRTFAREQLAAFAEYIADHRFWNAFIEQVVMLPNGDAVLVPKVGDFKITLGQLEGFEERMEKLMVFLQKGIRTKGWDRYKEINLKFDKEIVRVRRQ